MTRRRRLVDPRLLGPLLAGAAVVGGRELTRVVPVPAPAVVPSTTELPLPPAWRGPGAEASLRLQPERSRASFQVASTLQSTSADATGLAATLDYDTHGAPAALRLEIDLARLQPTAGDGDIWRLLGCKHTDRLQWTGRVVARTTFAVPGISRLELVGPLRFAGSVRSQPMRLWLAQVPPGRVVVQGVGTVDGDDFGLPRRYLFGMLPDRHTITLGLHLEFGRQDGGR